MKTATVTISYEEDKLITLRMYMELKDMKPEDELQKTLEQLYTKIVPAHVREYLDMKAGAAPNPAQPKLRRSNAGPIKPKEPTEEKQERNDQS